MNLPFFCVGQVPPMDLASGPMVAILTNLGPVSGLIILAWLMLDRIKNDQIATREWLTQLVRENRDEMIGIINQLRADGDRREATLNGVLAQQGELMREFSRSSHGICKFPGPTVQNPRRGTTA